MNDDGNHNSTEDTVSAHGDEHLAQSSSSEIQRVLSAGENVDNFRVVRLLGRGGMGEVYLARDMKLGRKVALKVIHARKMDSEQVRTDFFQEARVTARFNHPHILTIHAVGEHAGYPYLALEYLDGGNLRQRMEEEQLSPQEIIRIGLSIAQALTEAHSNGVFHRDLKPENVAIPPDGRLRVLDFGLARSMGPEAFHTASIMEGETLDSPEWARPESLSKLAGTPSYMAPEQWHMTPCSGATDIWALGIVLFELCAGQRPYKGANHLAIGMAVCDQSPVPRIQDFASIPEGLAAIVTHCLQKDPKKRPSATETVAHLNALLDSQQGGHTIEESPFRGLLPFSTRHAGVFFGRDAEIAAFMEQIRVRPLLPVVGPSGAGKSSFVRAGVIPRLRERGDWDVLLMRPGARPMTALATRLAGTLSETSSSNITTGPGESKKRRPDPQEIEKLRDQLMDNPGLLGLKLREAIADQRHILLVIDQLEEVFTLVEDSTERQRFIEAICMAADDAFEPIRVIFTIRDDFLGRLAMGPNIRSALRFITVIQRPGKSALRTILEQPAQARGYSFESPNMIDEMIDAVENEPACLPLLQFAATRLWDDRDQKRKVLLKESYEKMGGVEGALASHADGVLDRLTAGQQQIAQTLLLRMVTPERTRRVISKATALEGLGDETGAVLEQLAANRLISVKKSTSESDGDASLELAHESLCHNWKTLSRWIDHSREELVFLSEIGQVAELWDRRHRREEELWRGDTLADALRRAEKCTDSLPAVVRDFLQASRVLDGRRQTRKRRLTVIGGVLLAAIAIAAVLAAVAIAEKEKVALQERDKAEAQHTAALLEASQAAMVQGEMVEARAKLRLAMEKQEPLSTRARSLWWLLHRNPRVWVRKLNAEIDVVSFSPDGQKVVAAGAGAMLYFIDVNTSQVEQVRLAKETTVSMAISPDNKTVILTDRNGRIQRWEMDSWRPLPPLSGHTATAWGLSFHPTKELLASCGDDGSIRIWDLNTGEQTRIIKASTRGFLDVVFSPDGRTFATADRNFKIRIWNADTGKELHTLSGHTNEVMGVFFTPDGKKLISNGYDNSIRIWDPKSGKMLQTLTTTADALWSRYFALSPNGKWGVSGGQDKKIRVWNLETGKIHRIFSGHTSHIATVAFDKDSRFVASSGPDQSVRLWDITKESTEHPRKGHIGLVGVVRFSPDGEHFVSGGLDETIRLWNLKTGNEVRRFHGHTGRVNGMDFTPDGKTLVSAGNDNSIRVWNVTTGQQLKVLSGHSEPIWGAVFSPDGTQIASSSMDWSVRLWDVASGQEIRRFKGHKHEVILLDFHPHGKYTASGGMDAHVRIWDSQTGEQVHAFPGHVGPIISVRFSPDGRQVASAGDDGILRLWDLKTGKETVVGKHPGRIYAIDFNPDGTVIGAPGDDGVVRLWNLKSGKHLALKGHGAEAHSVSFAPDGQHLASSSRDGTIRTWTTNGRPYWRAPAVLSGPIRVFTHRGWNHFDGSPAQSGFGPQLTQAIEQHALYVAAHPNSNHLCMTTSQDTVELWNSHKDSLVTRQAIGKVAQLFAHTAGCVARTGTNVVLIPLEGKAKTLSIDTAISAIGLLKDDLLIAGDDGISVVDISGKKKQQCSSVKGVTALCSVGPYLAVGTDLGQVKLVDCEGTNSGLKHTFDSTPATPVARISAGPRGTVAVAFSNGLVGLWSTDDGSLLASAHLHGRINHLFAREQGFYAASELGDSLSWDLSSLTQSDCELMTHAWKEVPVGWKNGQPVVKGIPAGHRCSDQTGGSRL